MIIAIDGPAGAGKSTAARELARRLGWTFLDTGAMYRAVTLVVLDRCDDSASAEVCGEVARSLQLSFDPEGRILIDGRPAEPEIRSPGVDRLVSLVSAHGEVREAVVAAQRAVAGTGGDLVAEGRDTTTVVFPDAAWKFFLTAEPTERARRRALQTGRTDRQGEVLAEIQRRDHVDSTRSRSPLVRARDAVVIETDGLDAAGVVEAMLERVRAEGMSVEPGALATAPAAAVPRPPLTRRTLAYHLALGLARLLYAPMFRPRLVGREHVPREGGAVLAANHQSLLDIPLVAMAAAPRHVCFVARDTLGSHRWLGWLMARCGAVLLRRGQGDSDALREVGEHLIAGDLVAFFPEGTRSADGELGRFRRGALLTARRAAVPVVPIGIRGGFEAWPKQRRLPRPSRLSLEIGPPVDSGRPDALEALRGRVREMVGDGRFPDPGQGS